MSYEILLIPLIFIVSLALLIADEMRAFKVMLVLSVLLHKELFSIHMWDVLPIRIFMLAFFAYALFLLAKIFKKSGEFLKDPFVILMLLLWLVQGISIIFSKNLTYSIFLYGFSTTITAFVIYFYKRFKSEPDSVFSLIKFYVYVIFAACLFGFVQIYLYNTYDFIIGALWNIPGNISRVGSTFWDVNHFAALLAALMPVVGVYILTEEKIINKFKYFVMFGVMLVILLLTNSRTSWILAFVSFISFIKILLFRKYGFKGLVALALVLVMLTIPLAVEYSDKSSPFRAKVKDYFHYRIDSFDSHILLVRGALEVFEEKPVIGGGYGSFFEHFSSTDIASEYFGRDPAALNTRVPAHTIWGELLSETGILGFGIYTLIFILITGTLFYSALTSKNKKEILFSAAMGSVILGWHVAGIFYSYKAEFFWLVMVFYFTYGVGSLNKNFNINKIADYFMQNLRPGIIFISVLAFVLIFFGLGSTHLIPWDEAIYAEISKNMVESGDYLVQRWFTNKEWFEKPPLFMWFMAFFMEILDVNSWSARLPSAIAGFLTVLVTYFLGKKLYNRTVGFISAFVLLTTIQFLYYSRTAMTDVTTTLFITLALYFYWVANARKNLIFWLIAGVFTGLGVMTKGVVGLIPFMVIAIYEIYQLKNNITSLSKERVISYLSMFGACLLVFMPWHMLMYFRFGNEFIENYIGYHVVERATTSIEDKGRPWSWYITVLRVSMRLWFIALLGALPVSVLNAGFSTVRREYKSFQLVVEKDRENIFLLIYALSIFFFFSFATSKLVWYITPIYPAVSILVGVFIYRVITNISGLFKEYSSAVKFALLYMLVVGGLAYFYIVRDLVYVSDLTGKQAMLLQEKDEKFGTESIVYADRIEVPLIMFYSDSPFEVVDFGPLEQKLKNAPVDERVIFITKESRLRKLKETYPELKLEKQYDEWVLGYLPTQAEIQEALEKNFETELISQDVIESADR